MCFLSPSLDAFVLREIHNMHAITIGEGKERPTKKSLA